MSWPDGLPSEPLSDDHGLSRGTPLDRRYIEEFLSAHRSVIRGSVLELEDSTYTARFGEASTSEVLDVDPSNWRATIIADLTQPDSLPVERYDCMILTQTLQLLSDPGLCIENCWKTLRLGGSLLISAPAVSRVSPTYVDSDYWRFTTNSIRLLLERHWVGDFKIFSFGNLRTCIGFLLAQTVEETPEDAFAANDERFPLNVCAHAIKA